MRGRREGGSCIYFFDSSLQCGEFVMMRLHDSFVTCQPLTDSHREGNIMRLACEGSHISDANSKLFGVRSCPLKCHPLRHQAGRHFCKKLCLSIQLQNQSETAEPQLIYFISFDLSIVGTFLHATAQT